MTPCRTLALLHFWKQPLSGILFIFWQRKHNARSMWWLLQLLLKAGPISPHISLAEVSHVTSLSKVWEVNSSAGRASGVGGPIKGYFCFFTFWSKESLTLQGYQRMLDFTSFHTQGLLLWPSPKLILGCQCWMESDRLAEKVWNWEKPPLGPQPVRTAGPMPNPRWARHQGGRMNFNNLSRHKRQRVRTAGLRAGEEGSDPRICWRLKLYSYAVSRIVQVLQCSI